jgi:APA family basic amino acid/polyamine antiporter
MATLIAFAIVSLGVLILRYTQPALHRPFKTPLFPYIPSLGVLTCLLQICFLPLVTWLQFLGWTFLGLIFYFTYSMKRSKVRLK